MNRIARMLLQVRAGFMNELVLVLLICHLVAFPLKEREAIAIAFIVGALSRKRERKTRNNGCLALNIAAFLKRGRC